MLKWGILGLGNISKRLIQGLSYSEDGELYAVASYTKSKRESFKKEHPSVQVYSDYEAILEDLNIDIIYIALRHNDHYEWSKKAIKSGKAVLCEKPSTLHLSETKELCELSRSTGVFYMEAMKTRFLPTINEIKRLLDGNVIGKVERVETSFCDISEYDKNSYLYDEVQGGALYDLASYNLATILDYIDEDYVDMKVYKEFKYGVDVYDLVELHYPSGAQAFIEVGIDRKSDKELVIIGEKGSINARPFYRPESALIELDDGQKQYIDLPYINDDFYTQIEEVQKCVKNGLYESSRMTHHTMMKSTQMMEEIKCKDSYK